MMKILKMLAMILVVVGAINWGLVGAFEMNLVSMLLGKMPGIERLVYILVGIAGLLVGYKMFVCRSCCSEGK